MTIQTATISGMFVGPDLSGDKTMSATYEAYADGTVVTFTGLGVIGGRRPIPIQSDGTATLTIPLIPQAGLVPTTGVKWYVRVHVRGRVLEYFFTLTADTTWDAVLVPGNALAPPSLAAEAIAARDAAVAAAASVAISTWQPSVAVVAGQVKQAPDGTQIKRIASGTTRATYDATEVALWNTVATTPGTQERTALDAYGTTFNIKSQGAVANGTADNAAVINAVITTCNAAGGGTVLIPLAPLPWAVGSAIVMKANVTLHVAGTVKALASHAGVGVDVTNVSNVAIVGPGTIDMNKAATTSSAGVNPQHCINVAATGTNTVSGITVRDVTLQNSWQDGFNSLSTVSTAIIGDVTVDNVTISNVGNEGIDLRCIGNTAVAAAPSTSRVYTIQNCNISNPGRFGIRARGVSDVTVAGNTVIDSGSATNHGICMGAGSLGVTDDQVTDFTLTGNRVRGFVTASQWGIALSARCTRFEVSDNTVKGCTNGITIDLADPNNTTTLIDADGSVSGNSVIACVATSGGIRANQAKSLTLTGNTVRGCTGTGPSLALNNSYGLTATGNVVVGNAGTGIVIGVVGGAISGTGNHTVRANTSTGNTGLNYSIDPLVPLASNVEAGVAASAAAEVSVSNTTTETLLFGGTVPGGVCQAGTTLRVTAGLLLDFVSTSGTLTFRLKWGGVSGVGLASVVIPTQAGSGTSSRAFVDFLVTIRSSGASGSAYAFGNLRSEMGAFNQVGSNLLLTVDTSIDKVLTLTAAWATANVGNVAKLEVAAIEVVKS